MCVFPEGKLLDGNGCACSGELFLDLLCVFLGNAFLEDLGSAFNQVLSVLQAQTGDFANNLDNVELLSAEAGQFNVELGLLFNCCCSGSCCAANCYGSCCGYAKFLFNCLNQVSELEDSESLDFFNNSCNLFGWDDKLPPEL